MNGARWGWTLALALSGCTDVRFVGEDEPDGFSWDDAPTARDLTRLVPVLELQVEGAAGRLGVVGTHLKSGFEDADYVRRAVDAVRTAQAADLLSDADATLVMGDFNEDLADAPSAVPALVAPVVGLPPDWTLGADLASDFEGSGLRYDPFAPLVDRGFSAIDAERRRGGVATRPSSGRRIDYAWFAGEDGARVTGAEVYSSADEAWAGLADGPTPPYDASLFAADHLPLLVEVELPRP